MPDARYMTIEWSDEYHDIVWHGIQLTVASCGVAEVYQLADYFITPPPGKRLCKRCEKARAK